MKEIQKAFDNNLGNRRDSESDDSHYSKPSEKDNRSEIKQGEVIRSIPDGITRSDSSHFFVDQSAPRIDSDQFDSTLIDKFQYQIHLLKTVEDLTAYETQLEDLLSMIKHKKEILMVRKIEENQQKCVICLDAPPTMICIPCGHLCLCEG